jgi:hypothetical protein
VLYASLVTSLSALIAGLGASVARQGALALSFGEDQNQRVSRVERGLETQARVTEWQPVSHVIEMRAISSPEVSATALASAMDAAEGADLPRMKRPPVRGTPKARPVKPRVAGWIRRVAPVSPRRSDFAESTARIIERQLRAEM